MRARVLSSFDDPRFGAVGAGEGRRAEEEAPPILTDVCGTPEYFAPELVRLHQGESVADGGYNAKVRGRAAAPAAAAAAGSPHAYDHPPLTHPSPHPTTRARSTAGAAAASCTSYSRVRRPSPPSQRTYSSIRSSRTR